MHPDEGHAGTGHQCGSEQDLAGIPAFGAAVAMHADTLKGSKFHNMKELRIKTASSEIRVAFAFDPRRDAILLVAGDKRGVGEKRFYRQLIAKADALYAEYLQARR